VTVARRERVRISITPDTTTTPRLPRTRVRITPETTPRAGRVISIKPSLTILDAMNDERLFAPFFKGESWDVWKAILAAIFALPLTDAQLAHYQQVSGRTVAPTSVAKEVHLVIGRRGAKSRILGLISVWLSCFHDNTPHLAPGEFGYVQVIAADRDQAKSILNYIKAFLAEVPMLSRLIQAETQWSITLSNRIIIQITTNSFRRVRGRTVVAALCDEIAFWQSDDSANPDTEVISAIKPSMITIPDSMLLCASSPYSRRGVLFNAHASHFGKDDDPVLVFQAATNIVNPLVDQAEIDAAYKEDASKAAAEWGAEFRNDLEQFVSLDAIEACVSTGIYERPPQGGDIKYAAFADPSGGGADAFTLCIAHKDPLVSDLIVIDCIRETKGNFEPDIVVEKYSKLMKSYGISTVIGDKFGGNWIPASFKKFGITYEASARPKSQLYSDALPIINGKKVDLLDHPRTVKQFVALERRTSRAGRDSIDHPPGGHDDLCNCVAGAIATIDVKKYGGFDCSYQWAEALAGGTDSRTVEMMNLYSARRLLR
jgi:hypothetical protein